jgi:hypothetical protein
MHVEKSVRGVFLGPMEVAGYFARLSIGLEAIGVRTLYADLEDHPFSYAAARPAESLVRAARSATRRLAAARSPVGRLAWKVASLAARALLLTRAIAGCDTFVFGSGQTLFGRRELRLLELLGKRVVIVFFGTDVRPSYLDGIEARSPNATTDELVAGTREKRARIRQLERHASAIISHGPNSQLLSRDYAEWLAIGIPTVGRAAPEATADGTLRILHAPSHPRAKGTDEIRAAVEGLRRDGVSIEYREVQGAHNDIVMREIAAANVVVDQLYADTPMAVLASEAAAAGRPTVVGSLDWGTATAHVPPEALPPSVRCAPEELEQALRQLAESPGRAQRIGDEARSFVREHWSPEAVARRYLALANGTAPRWWFRSPSEITYAAGTGLPRHELTSILASVAAHGANSFGLEDKPELEHRMLAMASTRVAEHPAEGPSTPNTGRLP